MTFIILFAWVLPGILSFFLLVAGVVVIDKKPVVTYLDLVQALGASTIPVINIVMVIGAVGAFVSHYGADTVISSFLSKPAFKVPQNGSTNRND